MKQVQKRFALHSLPFTRELSVEQRFALPHFDDVVGALQRVVEERMSAALIAPAGTGKTCLLRALVTRLPEARYQVRYVKVTSLSRRDLCREIAVAVGAEPAGTYPSLVRKLQQRFESVYDLDGLRPVVVVDDSHEVRPEVLGLFKVLTNFDMDSKLVVSLLLCGQPPLRSLLRRDSLEDIARRLAHVAELRLLSREESRRYVEHRMTIAGATKPVFDDGALEALYEISRGNLRALDHLALKALDL